MKWDENLFVGDSIGKKINKIKWKINHNKLTLDIYLVCYPTNDSNLLDVIPAKELLQKAYPKDKLHILGVAKGYSEAIDLVTTIVENTVESRGDADVRAYLASLGGRQVL